MIMNNTTDTKVQLGGDLQLDNDISNIGSSRFFSRAADKMDVDCPRRIAPPQSRRVVRNQFEEVAGWISIDYDADVLVATRWNKRRLSDASANRPGPVSPTASNATATATVSVALPAPSSTERPSATATIKSRESEAPDGKKMRLVLASNAETIAGAPSQTSPNIDSTTSPLLRITEDREETPTKSRTTAFDESSDDDSGYQTGGAGSPNSTVSNQDDSEHQLISQLAGMQETVPTRLLPDGHPYKESDQHLEGETVLVEEQSAQHSKALRERARARPPDSSNLSSHFLEDVSVSPEPDPGVDATNHAPSSLRGTLNSISGARSYQSLSDQQKSDPAASSDYSTRRREPCPPLWSRSKASSLTWSTMIEHRGVYSSNSERERRSMISRSLYEPNYHHLPDLRDKLTHRVHFADESTQPVSREVADRRRIQRRQEIHDIRATQELNGNDQASRLHEIRNGHSNIVPPANSARQVLFRHPTPQKDPESGTHHEPQGTTSEMQLATMENVRSQVRSRLPLTDEQTLEGLPQRYFGPHSADHDASHKNPPVEDAHEPQPRRPTRIGTLLEQKREEGKEHALIPLGELAKIDIDNDEAVKAERTRLRDLRSSLTLIQETYLEMAKWYCSNNFNQFEAKLLEDARVFVAHVVHKQLPGKDFKQRMFRVRDSFRKKCRTRMETATVHVTHIEGSYAILLGESRALKIEDAISTTDKSLRDLEEALQAYKEQEKNTRHQAKAERLRQEHQTRKQFHSTEARSHISGHDRRAKRIRATKTDQKLTHFRNMLDQFEKGRSQVVEQESANQQRDEAAESVISEEDGDGEGFVQGGWTSTPKTGMLAEPTYHSPDAETALIVEETQDIEEINTLEDSRQQEQTDRLNGKGQAFDERLLLENQLAQVSRREGKDLDNEAQFDDLEVENDSDSDDDSVDPDSNNDLHGKAFRYSVTGHFYGVDIYRDADEYTFQHHYSRTQAEERVRKIISQLISRYALQHGLFDVKTSFGPEGMAYQELMLHSQELYAKLWIDKELIDLSRMYARKARKMDVIDVRSNWYVHWEKRVETKTSTPAGASIGNSASDDEDPLFGNSTPDSPAVDINIATERPDLADLEIFNNAYQANICAKDLYMTWYASFAAAHERPSVAYPTYDGQLRLVHEALQEEIESALEGVGAGPWETDFHRPTLEDEEGRTIEVKETMKVVVQRMTVKGPRN